MAGILPVNQMINQPNFVGNFQQGLQFGQQQRAQREQRSDQQQLRQLAPGVISGDSGAYEQAAAINPEAANQYQGVADNQAKRFQNWFNYTDQALQSGRKTGNMAPVNAALREGATYIQSLTGNAAPAEWSPDMDAGWEQLRAKAATIGQDQSEAPTGFRELHMKALAAGLQPGTPEYQQAMNINIGREGRAATGGFGFEQIRGPDGRERMGRTNPRTGMFEVYNEQTGDFEPQGGTGALNAGPAATQGMAAPMAQGEVPFSIDPSLPPEVQASIRANEPQWAQAQDGGQVTIPQQGGGPGLGVGRSPEEQAALTTGAQEQAKIDAEMGAFRQMTGLEAERTAANEQAKRTAASGVKRDEKRIEMGGKLQGIMDRQTMVAEAIDDALAAPGFDANFGLDSPRRFVPSTDASNAKARIQTVVNQIRLNVLSDLKALSPTGGAVGQVSNEEGRIMAGYLGALENSATDDEARRAMGKIKERMAGMSQRMRNAMDSDSGQQSRAAQAPRNTNTQAQRATNPQTGEVVELRNGQWVPAQ